VDKIFEISGREHKEGLGEKRQGELQGGVKSSTHSKIACNYPKMKGDKH